MYNISPPFSTSLHAAGTTTTPFFAKLITSPSDLTWQLERNLHGGMWTSFWTPPALNTYTEAGVTSILDRDGRKNPPGQCHSENRSIIRQQQIVQRRT
jgi:hypothetical protein